ncbi:hypothetical protein P280DRAFT_425265 [Massarina eburnea CBS 473.64]|uniref:Mediator of RNA polymerase II transcription subunit 13 n=1 Tax=Massarina eburnea CBS 473.64 TaxID=1395130 RepID=A0A6A6RZT7_9PLEO|nr:hypothetical protein P280DRAFT_425265 [Massarina eburnea CBS 473.64]
MEFLKSCNTNAQAIGEYEAVAYQAFSVARNPTATSKPFEWSPADDTRAAEAELRQTQHLVVHDGSRPWLWLFRPASAQQPGQDAVHLPVVDGFRFQREQYGIMKSSELARPPMRSASQTPSTGGSQPGASADQQQHDSFAIYELFTSSVVALILYFLVKDHQAVALNYRTVVSKPILQQDSDIGASPHIVPYGLTNVHVLWAGSGTLVVSTYSLWKPDLRSLVDVACEEQQKELLGRTIRVAPNGILAQITSFDHPLDASSNDIHQKLQRKRPRISPLEQGIEKWKSSVRRWLSWKGYSIPGLEQRSSWLRIRMGQSNQYPGPSSSSSYSARDILWPQALCFYYNGQAEAKPSSSTQRPASDRSTTALKWFETPGSAGYRDPLDAAQQWFLGKSERDKAMEARRRAEKADQDTNRAKEDHLGLLPSSPLNPRTGAYGDLQAVSGVYPTPPDGIPPGTAISSADTPNVAGASVNVILPPGGNNPAINLSAPQDMMQIDGQHPPTSPDFPLTYDQYNGSGNNDDLFEDMEEDGFEGNGVTDADFEFFDEPDEEDVDMLDAPDVGDDKKQSGKEKVTEIAVPEPPASAPTVKEDEPPDPMAALENALATASGQSELSTQVKPEQRKPAEESSQPVRSVSFPADPVDTTGQSVVSTTEEPIHPLSPRFIEDALLPSPKGKSAQQKSQTSILAHRNSVFDALDFNRKMSISDAKYQAGRFNFPTEKLQKRNDEAKVISQPAKSLRDMPLMTKLRYAIGVAAHRAIPEVTSPADHDSDLSDTPSEPSSVEDDMDEPAFFGPTPLPSGLIMPLKRKLPTDGNATPMSATSYADSFGGEFFDIGLHTDETTLMAFEPTSWDWALVNAPSPEELPTGHARYVVPAFSPLVSSMPTTPVSPSDISMDMLDEKPLSGKDSIAVAQIVTDQITSATLDILHENSSDSAELINHRPPSETTWQGAIRSVFPKATDCNVTALASVNDVFPEVPAQAKGQQRQPPRKPNEGPATLVHHMHQISPPYIRVRRADALWDLLPPALEFWEPLGLAPCSSAKNVVAFAIYPHSESLKLCVKNFMANIQLAYDSCRLGNHARVDTVSEYDGGLVPCKISNWTSTRVAFKALHDTCMQLGKLLAVKHAQMRDKENSKIDAFVIYMIDPFEDSNAIWELCSAFWTLFQSYGQGPPGRPDQIQKPDLVLQIVPIKYVASFEAPIILDASIYTSLAREVYDRCPPNAPCEDKTPLSIYTAPSFQLEEPLPRSIPFKLNAETPQDLLHENSYVHLGYAISLDGMWVTAAWTDICGKFQTVVSYNLGTRMFGEIAKEIWQTTIEILQARRVTWRVCIAKAGVMDREEMEAWIFFVSCPTQLNLFITLLAVDTEPHLKFTPTVPTPTNANPTATTGANTPGSTPQNVVSPDHGLTPAATPSAENTTDPTSDPDARLVDATDETWGIILAHRFHNSHSTNEFRPALISGLLVKHGATSPSTPPTTPDPLLGPIILAVNILWMGAVNPTRAATSPFPSAAGSEGISPSGGAGINVPQTPSPGPQERSYSSLTWTPTVPTRSAAENLLKEVLGQFRGLGLLGKLRGIRGTRGGIVPWHVAVCLRGVEGLGRVVPV